MTFGEETSIIVKNEETDLYPLFEKIHGRKNYPYHRAKAGR